MLYPDSSRCRMEESMPELPLDIIYDNILPRLPVKSLICLQVVTNQWRSFIKSRIFANMHLNSLTNDDHQNHYKFLKIFSEEPSEFCTIDCETLEVGASRPFPFEVRHGRICVESSCNGLVLLCIRNDDDIISDLIIWNPLTSDYKTLAETDINEELYCLGTVFELYYNSCDEDYKLVCVSCNHDVYIYSMKSDSWRKVNAKEACQFKPDLIPSRVKQSTCLEENLYFVESYRNENMITKFDTKTEKFTKICTPFSGNQFWSAPMVQGGYIYLWVKSYSHFMTDIELWMMKRDGEWMRVSTYDDELVDNIFELPQPLHLMKDGNWLMTSRIDGNLYKVDMENKHKGEAFEYTLLKGIEERRYIPTLLSPNQ